MTSLSARIVAVVLVLIQIGVNGIYAPTHRLLHHTLRHVDTGKHIVPGKQSASKTTCRSGCCHHDSNRPQSVANQSSDEQRHSAPCSDDESRCVWCMIALQQADSTVPAATEFFLSPVGLVSTVDTSESVGRLETAFDVRGPPII